MIVTLSLFALALCLLWIGSGMAVHAIKKLSLSMKMSSFAISFFVLGVFTSLTEIMVGVNALIQGLPSIFVGNLIGSSVVVLLLIVPLLAVVSKNLKLHHSFNALNLVVAVGVIGMPALLTLDGVITLPDALACLLGYIFFIVLQERGSRSLTRMMNGQVKRSTLLLRLLQIGVSVIMVFSASHILVAQTVHLANILGISTFLVSVLLLSVGTNIPELSIALRALVGKQPNIAFGNYLGSATFNTAVLGVLSLLSHRPIEIAGSNYSLVVFLISLGLFGMYAISKRTVTRKEGIALLFCYGAFVLLELSSGPGWDW